jgi:hypothetical protein
VKRFYFSFLLAIAGVVLQPFVMPFFGQILLDLGL